MAVLMIYYHSTAPCTGCISASNIGNHCWYIEDVLYIYVDFNRLFLAALVAYPIDLCSALQRSECSQCSGGS